MSSEPLEPNQDVIIPRSRDSLGRPVYKAQLTRTDNQSEKVALIRQTAPLPVIFIPGIMGTNLRNKADKSEVWRPPNGLWPMDDLFASIGALWTWAWRGPKARQELLKAEQVEVDDQVRSMSVNLVCPKKLPTCAAGARSCAVRITRSWD